MIPLWVRVREGGQFTIPPQQIFAIFPLSRSNILSCRALQTLHSFTLTFDGIQQPVYLKHLERDQIYSFFFLLCVHHVIFQLSRYVLCRANVP